MSPLVTASALVALAWLVATVPAEAPVDGAPRWDPPWLAMLVAVAVVLVGLAVVWWLFLVLRVQDRVRGSGRPRRRG